MNKSDVSDLYSNLFPFLVCCHHSVFIADLRFFALNTQNRSITVYHNITKEKTKKQKRRIRIREAPTTCYCIKTMFRKVHSYTRVKTGLFLRRN